MNIYLKKNMKKLTRTLYHNFKNGKSNVCEIEFNLDDYSDDPKRKNRDILILEREEEIIVNVRVCPKIFRDLIF